VGREGGGENDQGGGATVVRNSAIAEHCREDRGHVLGVSQTVERSYDSEHKTRDEFEGGTRGHYNSKKTAISKIR